MISSMNLYPLTVGWAKVFRLIDSFKALSGGLKLVSPVLKNPVVTPLFTNTNPKCSTFFVSKVIGLVTSFDHLFPFSVTIVRAHGLAQLAGKSL